VDKGKCLFHKSCLSDDCVKSPMGPGIRAADGRAVTNGAKEWQGRRRENGWTFYPGPTVGFGEEECSWFLVEVRMQIPTLACEIVSSLPDR
jgi:hypothetical protein